MPPFDHDEDVFAGSSSRLLAPKTLSPRRSPSRQSIVPRRSSASLRGSSSLAQAMDDDGPNGRHSLAHELAVALMPEPSAGSKLLAEEFGIEYDEGAEGIDAEPEQGHSMAQEEPLFANELDAQVLDASDEHIEPSLAMDVPPDIDPSFGSPVSPTGRKSQPEQDAMDILAQDLETTENFLSHLRRIDAESSGSPAQPALEKIASDMIRRINETARDREGQVRELLEYEREFRKIAGEVGGNDVLGLLDELEPMDDLVDKPHSTDTSRQVQKTLASVAEEPTAVSNSDWETDPDHSHLGDDVEDSEPESPLPVKHSFSQPPPMNGIPTPAKTIPQLAHLRTFTASIVSSLTTISEQAQVNGAATAEAGRKIRALKNKIGGWRTDWDSAEQSRLRIDKWEAGILDGEISVPGTPTRSPGTRRRPDGRKLVEEHLRGFENALTEASQKTQAIMSPA